MRRMKQFASQIQKQTNHSYIHHNWVMQHPEHLPHTRSRFKSWVLMKGIKCSSNGSSLLLVLLLDLLSPRWREWKTTQKEGGRKDRVLAISWVKVCRGQVWICSYFSPCILSCGPHVHSFHDIPILVNPVFCLSGAWPSFMVLGIVLL